MTTEHQTNGHTQKQDALLESPGQEVDRLLKAITPEQFADMQRAFDALIGEIDPPVSLKTPWTKQAWHRRMTWARWLRTLERQLRALRAALEEAQQQVKAHDLQGTTGPKSCGEGVPIGAWLPIKTAPAGQLVLVYWTTFESYEVLKQTQEGAWYDIDYALYSTPAHWMPLPAPPMAEAQDGGEPGTVEPSDR